MAEPIPACEDGGTSPVVLTRPATDTWTIEAVSPDDVGCLRHQKSKLYKGSYHLPFHVTITVVGSGCPAEGGGGAALSAETDFFLRGDANADGTVDIADPVFTVGSLFLGEEDPDCDDACDANDDGTVDISDAIATLGALFLGNGVIPLPGRRDCGVDPTDDALGCDTFDRCR